IANHRNLVPLVTIVNDSRATNDIRCRSVGDTGLCENGETRILNSVWILSDHDVRVVASWLGVRRFGCSRGLYVEMCGGFRVMSKQYAKLRHNQPCGSRAGDSYDQ